MKKVSLVACSLFLFTACSYNAPVVKENIIPTKTITSNCSEKDICETPSCSDTNCATCENESCENKSNPGAGCGCKKNKTETPSETKNIQENLLNKFESDGHDHDHNAMNTFENKPSQEIAEDLIARTISINAKKFEFSPNVIRIKKGETVKIKVNNIDMTHNITIPAFRIGNKEEAIFTATEAGEFEFSCANMCGRDHHDMVGKIIVE
jgi:cytochrome c oxidase subunit 2